MRNKLGKRLFSMLLSTMMVFNMAPVNLTAYAAAGDIPAHEKSRKNNGDGTYTLALNVTGEAEKKPSYVNVTVVFDTSSSMNTSTGNTEVTYTPTDSQGGYFYQNNLYGLINGEYRLLSRDGDRWSGYTFWYNNQEYTGQRYIRQEQNQTRLQAAEAAVNELASALLAYNGQDGNPSNTVEMALVDFANMAEIAQAPTTSYSAFEAVVNSRDAGNNNRGTNWEAGLQTATTVDYGDTDPTYVIFVSDGNPTFYVNNNGTRGGTGQETTDNVNTSYEQAVPAAQAVVASVGADNFYTIGVYGNVDRMESLTTASGGSADNYYSAENTAALQEALAEILKKIEMAGIGNVSINDGTTNQVKVGTTTVELLEVDENSYKYWRAGGDYGTGSDGLGTEWKSTDDPAPPAAQLVDGAVQWDLSSLGVLENGVTYTVTFDCYPSQTTYDYIAQLKNGDIQYSELPSEVRQYLIEVTPGVSYSLKTNTNATLSYDDTRTEETEESVAFNDLDAVATDASTLSIVKVWEGDDAPSDPITVTILMDDEKFHETELRGPSWTADANISIGIIKNGQALPGAEGHDFSFAELDGSQYHWEIDAPTVRPMLINGTKTMLVKVDDKHPIPSGATRYTIEGATYYVDSAMAGLTATNHRRSNLNLKKIVTGEDAPKTATFPFTLTVNNSMAPATEPTDDPDHNSDYWVWFSIYDTVAGKTVTDATISGATGPNSDGYYYAPSNTAISVEMKHGWNLRFINLPSGTTYTFAEGRLADGFAFKEAKLTEGEDSTFRSGQTTTGKIEKTKTSYAVEYTNDYELTDLEVTKVWNDNSNQDGKRLTADELKEKLTLSPTVTGKDAAVVDNGDNTYTITYTGLPRFDNGEEVEYTVTESAIDGYTTTGSPAKDHGTITNTHTPEVTSVKVTKVWDDENNIGNIRPASINVQLKADGTDSGDPVTLNADNEWTHTWENLPKFNNGTKIVYTADETAVPTGYKKSVTGDAENGFTITNTYSPTSITASFPVKKILTVPQGLEGPAEWSYTINVAANNGAPEAETMTGTVTNTADTATFGPITYTVPGEYTYTVSETGTVAGVTNDAEAAGKTVTVTVEDDGTGKLTVKKISSTEAAPLTFTNTYSVAPVTASFPVKKILSVPEGMSGPETWSYTINVAANNGAPAATTMTGTVNQDNDTVTFGGFTYTAPGTYTYKVTETGEVAGVTNDAAATTGKTVTVTVVDNKDGTLTATASSTTESPLTFTNTYGADPTTASFPVKKILSVPAGMTGPATWSFDITVSAEEGVPVAETMTGKVSNTQDTVTFGPITYTAPGTYTYTVTESGTVAGVTNDAAATTGKTVTVTVEDDGTGNLTVKEISSTEAAPLTFTNVYGAEPVTAKFPIKKVLNVPEGMTGPEKWSYTIDVAANGNAPAATTMTGTVDQDNDTVTFGDFTYTAPGTYTYKVTETGTVAGVTNDAAATTGKTVTVTVKDNGDGTLTATADSTADEPLTFTNTYSVKSTTANFPVQKILSIPEGMTGPEKWSYTINVEANDGAPAADTMTGTVTNAADTATFGPITYTAPGTYTYTVSETGTVAGVTNDAEADGKTVTVTVVDNGDGTLTATPTSTDDEPLTFTNTYSVGEITTSFPVKKILSVPEGMSGPETWSYTIDVAANDGAPEAETMTGTVTKAADTATFGPITYTVPGTYTYTVSETGKVAGVTNDGDAAGKTVTVTVVDNGNGTLTATPTSTDEDPLTFTNTYSVEPTTAKFPVEKIMSVPEGLTGPAEWSYTINVEANDGAPEAETMTGTVTKAADTATFGPITYTAPGTYTYTVSETGTVAGVTNDKDAAGKTVTVTVVDNGDGTLTATPTSTDDEPLTFTNTYSVEPTTAEFPVEKIMSKAVESMTGPEDWSYDIKVAAEDGAPEAETMTGTVTKAAPKATFGGFSFTVPGTYKYTVTETGSVKGVTNDPEAETGKTVTVNVTDNGNGTLTASPSSAEKNPLTFTNTYDIEPTEITLEVTKELKGRDWEEGETYEFELLDESGEPLGTASASNANPVAAFAPITYTAKDLEKGKFTYTIREIEPDQKGEPYCYVTYDEHEVTATVTLTDNGDGTMSAKTNYTGETTFTNVYEDTTYTVTKVWDDADNRLQIRPDTLTIMVYGMVSGDTLFEQEVTLNADNNWTLTLENLPAKYNGYEIEYYAEETSDVTGYTKSTASDAERADEGLIFVNTTDTGDLSIKKYVNSATKEFDKDDTKDYQFTVTVESDDDRTFSKDVVFYTAKANSSDGKTTGTITFRNGEAKFTLHSDEIVRIVGLPAGATYKVEESVDASTNYDPVFFNNEGTILNGKTQYVSYINRELDERTLKIIKKWEDGEDRDGFRPDKIKVNVYKVQGEEEKLYAENVELTAENSWTELFNLDGYDAVATVADATKTNANASASSAYTTKASASTASSSSASFSDAAVTDAFDEDGVLKDGTIFDDLFTVVKDAVKEAAGKIGTLFGIDDDTEISFRVEETEVPDYYDVTYDDYNTETHELTFTNTHELMNPVWIDPPVKKIISVIRGTITTAETFVFRMTGLDGTTEFPAGATLYADADGNPYMELTITGEGSEEFGKIEYDKAGTYKYRISEVKGSAGYYTYSTDTYEITAEVKVEGGKLVENVTVVKNGSDEVFTIKTSDGVGGDVLGIEFVNTYDRTNGGGGGNSGGGGGRRGHTPSTPVEPGSPVLPEVPVPGALPKTGESSGKAVPMLFAMLAMFGALFGFKKRDDDDEQ